MLIWLGSVSSEGLCSWLLDIALVDGRTTSEGGSACDADGRSASLLPVEIADERIVLQCCSVVLSESANVPPLLYAVLP